MTQKNHYTRIIRRWHAQIGLVITVFIVFIVLTGIVLNHEEALKLDKREISVGWLMHWYGLHAAEPKVGYLLGAQYFSWEGEKWALGNKPLTGSAEQPVGAIEVNGVDYVATSSALYIYQSPNGGLLDKLEKQSLPATPILAVGKVGESVLLKTPTAVFKSSDSLNWEQTDQGLIWAMPQALPDDVSHQMKLLLAPGLSMQRLLLDIHSGRIFGRYGPWALDVAAITLLLLGLSGLWIYWRSMKQGKLRHKP